MILRDQYRATARKVIAKDLERLAAHPELAEMFTALAQTSDAIADALWQIHEQENEKEPDDRAGLIHQVASPTAETEPRPTLDVIEYLNLLGGDSYLAYAGRHLRAALLKLDDAPCSSAQHERQAKVALQMGRVPTIDEGLDWASEAPRDPETWPCSFGYHVHVTRAEAVECARRRIQVASVSDSASATDRADKESR